MLIFTFLLLSSVSQALRQFPRPFSSSRSLLHKSLLHASPLSNFANWYDAAITANPVPVKMITSGFIGGVGDGLVQKIEKKQPGLDLRRLFIFTIVSIVYFAPFIHYWFAYLESIKFAPHRSQLYKATVMMLIDQIIGAVVLKSGFFYAFALADHYTPPVRTNRSVFTEANELVKKNLLVTLKANWLFWPFVNFLTFLFVPIAYRVLVSNTAAVLWNMFLSNLVNKRGKS